MRRRYASLSALNADATASGVSGADAGGRSGGAAVTGPERTVGPAGLGALENIRLYHGLESVVVAGGSAEKAAGALAPTASAAIHQARKRGMVSPKKPRGRRAFPSVGAPEPRVTIRGERRAYADRF